MKSRILTISRAPSGNTSYPFINISGKWLKDNGFTVGERVLVDYQKGTIQIRTIKLTNQEVTGLKD